LTNEGFPVEYEIQVAGLTFGLATVSVCDSLLNQRLAWVAIIQPAIKSSCLSTSNTQPAPAPTPKVPKLPGYQVLVIDADTGAAGFDYAASRNENCFAGKIEDPSLTPAVEDVSVRWTLVSRNADNYSGTINSPVRSCDGFGSGSAYDVSGDRARPADDRDRAAVQRLRSDAPGGRSAAGRDGGRNAPPRPDPRSAGCRRQVALDELTGGG
jgi:hypothetical protein